MNAEETKKRRIKKKVKKNEDDVYDLLKKRVLEWSRSILLLECI